MALLAFFAEAQVDKPAVQALGEEVKVLLERVCASLNV